MEAGKYRKKKNKQTPEKRIKNEFTNNFNAELAK